MTQEREKQKASLSFGHETGRLRPEDAIPCGQDYGRRALLPDGFRDELPPFGDHQAAIVSQLMAHFHSLGYDRVRPPLVEYEDSLLMGTGATRSRAMFRLMDPDTQRVMAIRADMTPQISRLAATRLKGRPRPLRLAYAGTVLRVKSSQLRPTREFMQAGFELIGPKTVEADCEVITAAVGALQSVGLTDASVDLTAFPLLGYLAESLSLTEVEVARVEKALAHREKAALGALSETAQMVFSGMMDSVGPAERALQILKRLNFKGPAQALLERLDTLILLLKDRLPATNVTIDVCEHHGFEYKTGIGFAIFCPKARAELGRGGRYLVDSPDDVSGGQLAEEAVGFSAYLDTLMSVTEQVASPQMLYVPYAADVGAGAVFRRTGWRTVRGLEPLEISEAVDSTNTEKLKQEALRLGCTHILLEAEAVAL